MMISTSSLQAHWAFASNNLKIVMRAKAYLHLDYGVKLVYDYPICYDNSHFLTLQVFNPKSVYNGQKLIKLVKIKTAERPSNT